MDSLPAPRLQLRWRKPTAKEKKRSVLGRDWTCVYELILPLGEGDIRRKAKRDFQALEICRTFVGTTDTNPTFAPFRDGCHARWDSKLLGNLPIYIVAPDGSAIVHAPASEGFSS